MTSEQHEAYQENVEQPFWDNHGDEVREIFSRGVDPEDKTPEELAERAEDIRDGLREDGIITNNKGE